MTKAQLIKELEKLEQEHRQLKQVVEEVLFNTYAPGNGGYRADFGPIAFSTMLKITGFNIHNRKIEKTQ